MSSTSRVPANILTWTLALTMCACGASNQGGDHEVQVRDADFGADDYDFEVDVGVDMFVLEEVGVQEGGAAFPGTKRYTTQLDLPDDVSGSGVAYLVGIWNMGGVQSRQRVGKEWDVTVVNGEITNMTERQ